jgi:hypothetical protein
LDVAKQSYITAIKAGEAADDFHTSAFASYELGMTLCRNPEVISAFFPCRFSKELLAGLFTRPLIAQEVDNGPVHWH